MEALFAYYYYLFIFSLPGYDIYTHTLHISRFCKPKKFPIYWCDLMKLHRSGLNEMNILLSSHRSVPTSSLPVADTHTVHGSLSAGVG